MEWECRNGRFLCNGKVAVDRRQLAERQKGRRRKQTGGIHPLGGISANTSALIYGEAF